MNVKKRMIFLCWTPNKYFTNLNQISSAWFTFLHGLLAMQIGQRNVLYNQTSFKNLKKMLKCCSFTRKGESDLSMIQEKKFCSLYFLWVFFRLPGIFV